MPPTSPASFDPTPRALVVVEHPFDSEVIPSDTISMISTKIVSSEIEVGGNRETTLASPLTEEWRKHLANGDMWIDADFVIDYLARPREVGSCYVPLPELQHPTASVRSDSTTMISLSSRGRGATIELPSGVFDQLH